MPINFTNLTSITDSSIFIHSVRCEDIIPFYHNLLEYNRLMLLVILLIVFKQIYNLYTINRDKGRRELETFIDIYKKGYIVDIVSILIIVSYYILVLI